MAGFTDAFELLVLNLMRPSNDYTSHNTMVALCTTAPTDAAAGTEVTGGSYARQQCDFSAASGGAMVNSADITFPTATADWGTVTHFELWNYAGTVRLGWAALTASKNVLTNDVVKFVAGALSVTLD